MMRHFFMPLPSNLTAVLKRSSPYQHTNRAGGVSPVTPTHRRKHRLADLPQVPCLVDGCDYDHWLVVMHPPDSYPKREEIIQQYVTTLASAIGRLAPTSASRPDVMCCFLRKSLGRDLDLMLARERWFLSDIEYVGVIEKAAMDSIYSVSTKYYFAFSCRVGEDVAYKIKSLPRVKWVLPDSYLGNEESGYGGEPYVNGEVCAYDDKYHADWLRDNYGENSLEQSFSRKSRRRSKVRKNSHEISG